MNPIPQTTTIQTVERFVRRLLPDFRYLSFSECPFARLDKPLSRAKVALITTGGVFPKGQTPFSDNYGLGDPSYREIPADVAPSRLSRYHEHYDHSPAMQDINVVFPYQRLKEAADAGMIGAVAETHYSFMGYVPVPQPLMKYTAPDVASKLQREGVDAVVLVPVWPVCQQTAGLVARVIEARGIATVVITQMRDVAEQLRIPRGLHVEAPFGSPVGTPGDVDGQLRVLRSALRLLEDAVEAGHIAEMPRWTIESKRRHL